MKNDYVCPHCRRVQRLDILKRTLSLWCPRCRSDVPMERIPWGKADWSLVIREIAQAMNLSEYVVGAKRRELGKPRGTKGRKQPKAGFRKVNPALIRLGESNQANALRLECTAERIRQLRKRIPRSIKPSIGRRQIVEEKLNA